MNVSKISKYLQKCYCSVAELCPTLCGLMDWSTPGFPVLHHPWSLFKFMSIESVMPSNHLIFCPLLLLPSIFPSIRVYSKSRIFALGGQSIGASASASVLPMNIQGWFPLASIGWSLSCPGNSQESSPAPQFKSINSSALSLLYGPTLTSIHDYWKNRSFDYMDLCQQSNVSAF